VFYQPGEELNPPEAKALVSIGSLLMAAEVTPGSCGGPRKPR